MSLSTTYRAVLFGPNPIAAGTQVELEYSDGSYQDIVVLESVEDTYTITRIYKRGRDTEEPISYHFVEDYDDDGEVNVPN